MIEPDEHQGCKTAYLVRLKPDQSHPREFVGIFVAEDERQLQEIVDECCEADACEYIVLPSGGLYKSDRSGTIPAGEGGPDLFAGAAISDFWLDGFHSQDHHRRWTSLAIGAANDPV